MVLPVLVVFALAGGLAQPVGAVPADPGWVWPVTGPVIAPFDPPDSPYGSGHRGIDIAAPVGTPVLAPAAGVVTFAGPVGGRLYVTVDHGGGVLSTSSFLSSLAVRRNDVVEAGQTLGASGTGHAGALIAHVHFSVRLDTVYVDPLDYLAPLDLSAFIRLAPTG
jgi:murein DD-endopeptidase MepM/ murein hydrolase activator NlpD